MRMLNIFIKMIAAISLLAIPGIVLSSNSTNQQEPIVLAAEPIHHGEGTIMVINKKEGKVKLNHGPIKSIGWMSMKMMFDVEDSAQLEDLNVGDKVGFDFIKTRDNRYVVTEIEQQ